MGFYIEVPEPKHKSLVKDHGAKRVEPGFEPAEDEILVCVVDNGMFTAAGIVFDKEELEAFSQPDDPRSKVWLVMKRDKVRELAPGAKNVLVPGYNRHTDYP